MAPDTFPFAYPVKPSRVVDKDETVVVRPETDDLKSIAAAYDLVGIGALEARFTLRPFRKKGIRVVGPINATVTQTCVVSLEPFESDLTLHVDRTFEPHSGRSRRITDLNEEGEIEIDLESLDPPDVIADGVLDLGAVICEELALSLDPFPRRPGVEFHGEPEGQDPERETGRKPSPFAALKALKDEAED